MLNAALGGENKGDDLTMSAALVTDGAVDATVVALTHGTAVPTAGDYRGNAVLVLVMNATLLGHSAAYSVLV